MSGPLIILTGLVYFWVSAEQLFKGNGAMAITFGAYAVANIGLYLGVSR